MVGLQVGIIYVGSRAFSIKPGGLSGTNWAISVVAAVACLPWGIAVRLFPDAWFARVTKVVSLPVVIVYDGCCKMMTSIGNIFRNNKKTASGSDINQNDIEAVLAVTKSAVPEAISPPTIVVYDTPQNQSSNSEKVEK